MVYRLRVFAAVIFVAVLSGVFVTSSQPVAAAGTAVSLTTSPVSLDLTIKPGTSTTKTLQLMNNGSQPLQINIQLKVFSAHGTGGQAAVSSPAPGDPSPNWMHFSTSSFTAHPGVWAPVQMTLNVPKNASLGYYYAVVFQPQIPAATGPGKNTVKGSNAILILVDTQSAY